MRFRDLLENTKDEIQEGDSFDLELEHLVIETHVVGFMRDGVVLAADDVALAYLTTEDDQTLDEAEYHGHKVTLNKKMQGDVKKSKVYVKDPTTGNIKKVNFGDKTMRIKKSNPARRKSYRARHNCANPGPKTKANYWSCRSW
jgi:hypothetical protein